MVLLSTERESIMSTNIVLLIVACMLIFAALRVYYGYMKIANELYARLVEDSANAGSKKSPYSIRRVYSSYVGKDCYYIYNGDEAITHKSFWTAKDAQVSMNELEQLGGYVKTKVV